MNILEKFSRVLVPGTWSTRKQNCIEFQVGLFKAEVMPWTNYGEMPVMLITNTTPCMLGEWANVYEGMLDLFNAADRTGVILLGHTDESDIDEWCRRFPFLEAYRERGRLRYFPGSRKESRAGLDASVEVRSNDNMSMLLWEHIGEGYCEEYDPLDPKDKPLLRFSIYDWIGGHWERDSWVDSDWKEREDGSYCTLLPVGTPDNVLIGFGRRLLGATSKRELERLTWMKPEELASIYSGEEHEQQ